MLLLCSPKVPSKMTLLFCSVWPWKIRPFMAGPKSVFEMVHISRAEIAEENILQRVLEKRVCLFADTFTYGSNCYRK